MHRSFGTIGMRVAGRFVLTAVVALLITQSISSTVQPSDRDDEGQGDTLTVLCGTITQDAETFFEFYVTCPVIVQTGVTLRMGGLGIMDPWVSITVYGTLILSAYMTWNTSWPASDPEDRRWQGIMVYSPGHIDGWGFEIYHTIGWGIIVGTPNNVLKNGLVEDVVTQMGLHDGYAIAIGSHNNTIEGVSVRNSFGGVFLDGGPDNVIRKSSFRNLKRGIRMGDMTEVRGNTIVCNDFLDNENYVVAQRASDNRFHHNNFLGQGFAYEEWPNIWDDGYPNGGNYWADYVGNDSYRGPNQDFPGSDGLGDEPYKGIYDFGNGNYDNYPFMNPVQKSGCPSPPPQMPKGPFPPYALSAQVEGVLLSDVNMSWNLSWDDGNPGFQNYTIYYSQNYRSDKSGYDFLAEVPAGTSFFNHSGAGHGDSKNYFYYVQANDSSGYPGKSYGQVAKFTKGLKAGMNLVSIPLILTDLRLESVFQTANVERIMTYNTSTTDWKEYNVNKAYQMTWLLNPSHGLWVEVNGDSNLTIAGVVPASSSMNLGPGWNLVSYQSFISREASISLLGIPYQAVEAYEATKPPYYLVALSATDHLTAGNAYWIKVSFPCTWTVSN